MRLDLYLFQKGEAASRTLAKEYIAKGLVTVNGRLCKRPAEQVSGDDIVVLSEYCPYVGRGAYKLKKAQEVFGIDFSGLVCGDFGASAGGFTQVMLMGGAKKVYAVDVGHGQLDKSLAQDGRVVNAEGVNIRDISSEIIPCPLDFAAADLSFISLRLALSPISLCLKESGRAVMLIKPQFECGREFIGKGGIVKSPRVHVKVIGEIAESMAAEGIAVKGLCYSPITGGSGNIEYLIFGEKGGEEKSIDIGGTVKEAWQCL